MSWGHRGEWWAGGIFLLSCGGCVVWEPIWICLKWGRNIWTAAQQLPWIAPTCFVCPRTGFNRAWIGNQMLQVFCHVSFFSCSYPKRSIKSIYTTSFLGDGRVSPPETGTFRSTWQTSSARYWDLSKLHLLVFANAIPGENLPPGPFSNPCSMSLRERVIQCDCHIPGGHKSVMGTFVCWRCSAWPGTAKGCCGTRF